jgi:hypothetical protein
MILFLQDTVKIVLPVLVAFFGIVFGIMLPAMARQDIQRYGFGKALCPNVVGFAFLWICLMTVSATGLAWTLLPADAWQEAKTWIVRLALIGCLLCCLAVPFFRAMQYTRNALEHFGDRVLSMVLRSLCD